MRKKTHSEAIFLFGEGVNFKADGISRKFPQIKFSFDGWVVISRKSYIKINANYT